MVVAVVTIFSVLLLRALLGAARTAAVAAAQREEKRFSIQTAGDEKRREKAQYNGLAQNEYLSKRLSFVRSPPRTVHNDFSSPPPFLSIIFCLRREEGSDERQ